MKRMAQRLSRAEVRLPEERSDPWITQWLNHLVHGGPPPAGEPPPGCVASDPEVLRNLELMYGGRDGSHAKTGGTST
ncbi:MAG TPA: hypothetical protein VFZ59_04500 [Verrucomicrobiae bacterium]|nr:hypothetical protein [Verrucomicrobiae bacterium]